MIWLVGRAGGPILEHRATVSRKTHYCSQGPGDSSGKFNLNLAHWMLLMWFMIKDPSLLPRQTELKWNHQLPGSLGFHELCMFVFWLLLEWKGDMPGKTFSNLKPGCPNIPCRNPTQMFLIELDYQQEHKGLSSKTGTVIWSLQNRLWKKLKPNFLKGISNY